MPKTQYLFFYEDQLKDDRWLRTFISEKLLTISAKLGGIPWFVDKLNSIFTKRTLIISLNIEIVYNHLPCLNIVGMFGTTLESIVSTSKTFISFEQLIDGVLL